ncbi:MAG TPA: hypothetical protein DET40_23015 [Lentisphaeria bacterium]|nr:MAG: hypothetical protein A2X45_15770 [Lentisphaerae bacterium GWF2_50_93]HCE46425.1 hypothetical protein [Lentisphaeria bacterium]
MFSDWIPARQQPGHRQGVKETELATDEGAVAIDMVVNVSARRLWLKYGWRHLLPGIPARLAQGKVKEGACT